MTHSFSGKISNVKTIRILLAAVCSLTFLSLPLVAATIVRPTLTITSPTNGQLWSNDTFTVTGTAAGSAGISNVLFSLNKSATWTNTVIGDDGTNWSQEITLTPGTNIFSACAVDNNNIHSLTNTVKLVYYVTAILTVRTNGSGTISPAYNGQQLLQGATYTMTAVSTVGRKATGYGFRNWTDGSGNIVGTGGTLKFTMSTNLTLTANFSNLRPPSIDIISSTTNSDGVANDFVIHGVASDDQGVTNVIYRINSGVNAGVWQNATTTNGWKTWNAPVTLVPGANTFNAYAIDISSNFSTVLIANITYNTAPLNLSGKFAVVSDNANSAAPSSVAFNKSTFSQTASDTNNFNAVGSYTYTDSGGGNATLKYKFTGPPSVAHVGSQSIALFFNTPTYAYFTNFTTKIDGYMYFSTASNLAPASANGQLIWTISSGAGDGRGALFQKSTYTSQALLSGDTNGGKYTYTKSSPLGVLFKLSRTNGTAYVLATYADTNHGSYYEEDYDSAGHTNGTDIGKFFIASQTPGGNAPTTITNRNFEITSGQDSFNVQLGADTYSQDTLASNFDNAVGDYTYASLDTNIGQLNLTVTEPPSLAGSNSAARLIFVNGNSGFFTNDDSTFSSFIMTTATNLAPDNITNFTLTINYNGSGSDKLQFANDGSLILDSQPGGNYAYAPFSPGGSMIQLSINTNNFSGSNPFDWLQLNFKTTNSGNFFLNTYDSDTNNDSPSSGTFNLQ